MLSNEVTLNIVTPTGMTGKKVSLSDMNLATGSSITFSTTANIGVNAGATMNKPSQGGWCFKVTNNGQKAIYGAHNNFSANLMSSNGYGDCIAGGASAVL